MRTLRVITRSLLGRRQSNFIKILSLGAGLAVGIILSSKVLYDLSYDDFYPDKERIYRIFSNTTPLNEPPESWGSVSGAIAPGMKAEVPGVEAATRITRIGWEPIPFIVNETSKLSGKVIMADEFLFDILPLPIINGNPGNILAAPMQAMVSRSMAEKIGREAIGSILTLESFPGREITISGIYEDHPKNSHQSFDVVVSLCSIGNFFYDGRDNWSGNDRYRGYVKLSPGVDPESLAPAIRAMQERNQEEEEYAEDGYAMSYTLVPLTKVHIEDPEIRRMLLIYSLLAFIIIAAALINYILVTISTMLTRSRQVAVYKCYGASARNIYKMQFLETGVHILAALVLGLLLVLIFRTSVEEIISSRLSAIFNLRSLTLVAGICVIVFLVSAYVPARIFISIPPMSAFRTGGSKWRFWKKALLFVQFAGAAYIVVFLTIIAVQHHKMVNDDPGYNYKDLLFIELDRSIEGHKFSTLAQKLSSLPEISGISAVYNLPFDGASGNYVHHPETKVPLFNYADLYDTDENYLPLMGIEIIEGENFVRGETAPGEAMVSRSFAERVSEILGWDDGIVGKTLHMGEHEYVKIRGVYENFRLGSIMKEDTRPSAMFYTSYFHPTLVMKTEDPGPVAVSAVDRVLKEVLPDKTVYVKIFSNEIDLLYTGSRLFRKSMTAAGIVVLLIVFTGLLGYTRNELLHRRREIAIRKVNGADRGDILRMFGLKMALIAVPALFLGGTGGILSARHWMTDFTVVTQHTTLIMFSVCILLLAVIMVAASLVCLRMASENPAQTIKSE